MNLKIIEMAKKNPSLTIRFHHIYDNGMIVRVETNRKIVACDVVTNMGNLGRLFLISIKKLMEKK